MLKKLKVLWGKLDSFIDPIGHARRIGVSIGENCKLNGTPHWGSEPELISIGNRTELSFGVSFITHDGATWVFRDKEEYKAYAKKMGRIEIGDHTFVGANVTIMPGVKIGNRVVVGACALVTKGIPDGEVWAGIPAKFLMTTEEYIERCAGHK